MKEFFYQGKYYPIKIIRKRNKNTYIRIREGEIIITTTLFMTTTKILKLLQENKATIEKMIEKEAKKHAKENDFFLLGKKYEVIIKKEKKEVEIEEDSIYSPSIEQLDQAIQKYSRELFQKHLQYYYALFEEKIPSPNLKIRKMKTRWGVCNTKNYNITLNSELIKYEIECLDYVIIHELSHFIEPNHSTNFWKIVSKYCPNYKEIRKKLRS